MLLCFLKPTTSGRALSARGCPRRYFLPIYGMTGARSFLVSDEHQTSPGGDPCHRSKPRRFPIAACCLHFGAFLCPICKLLSLLFHGNLCPASGTFFPSRSLVRRTRGLVVTVRSSKRYTSFASVQMWMIFCDQMNRNALIHKSCALAEEDTLSLPPPTGGGVKLH